MMKPAMMAILAPAADVVMTSHCVFVAGHGGHGGHTTDTADTPGRAVGAAGAAVIVVVLKYSVTMILTRSLGFPQLGTY
ncbi:hypothetical protein F4820DRAFT_441277 [Hypoxylon rubiginosum]|uniref:Uncharacterized protein n=1 Tax=Hypoxylon rubiginosum TaxID=110542 RepID=A0ACB9YHP6_9PEZI|nr:hypothetical protein F4820DRAFT_441277 [Hypoxylon rubiginosum]